MKSAARFRSAWDAFFERNPRLRWIRRWGISLASLVMGVATILAFRRGVEYFPLFIGYLLLLWLVGVVFAGARHGPAARAPRVLALAIDYTVQTLLHGLFLFLVPIYYASTTLTSGNVWLLSLLVAATTLTTIDPWYRAVVAHARWTQTCLFWLGLFASLNAALPLIRVAGEWVLVLSGSLSTLAIMPAFGRHLRISALAAALYATTAAVALALGLWWIRAWIPPVPLHLARATFARAVQQLEPMEPVARISGEEVREWGRVVAFTAIAAPSGLSEPVYHVWKKDGRTLGRMLVTTVRGGRAGGFRTYSWKSELGADPSGLWWVDVTTVHGQLIGRVRLLVTTP